MSDTDNNKPSNFIHQIIEQDLQEDRLESGVVTRFPPEPNGYLHIGHAKSIYLNFSTAKKYQGVCNLRFDDTNPQKEEQEYINSISEDVAWLGFSWNGDIRYTSNYFDQLYEWAVYLIKEGKAYVCNLNAEQTREYRGNFTTPGKDSPYRERSVAENLELFEQMRQGKFAEGSCSLRAKIDMQSPNMNLRDPMIYRIIHTEHHQTGNKWCIYPTYDFAHGQSDAIEGITHSICTLEFEDHKPLYNWFISNLPVKSQPKQYEFARLELSYTITSKRKLKQLVDNAIVNGWNDPRMPTISGLRRRGYTADSIKNFCENIGVTRSNGVVDISMLEASIREDLDKYAPRAMCVLKPLRLTLTNYEEAKEEWFELPNHPKDESMGVRSVPFSRNLWIEQDDFAEIPPSKWKRLSLGTAVRLRGAYVITCNEVIKNKAGEIIELKCKCDLNTKGTNPEGYKPKGVIHWVSAKHAISCEVREYDRLFNQESPDTSGDFVGAINPDSLKILSDSKAEASLAKAQVSNHYQFERTGYFTVDLDSDIPTGKIIFNRTVSLRDTWK